MVIQFGYIALFALALPLAPLIAFINNILEIRGDAFKLTRGLRRPPFASIPSIGTWLRALEGFIVFSIITNSTISALVNSTFVNIHNYFFIESEIAEGDGATYMDRCVLRPTAYYFPCKLMIDDVVDRRLSQYQLWIWVFLLQNIMLMATKMLDWSVAENPAWIDGLRGILQERFATLMRKELALLRSKSK